MEIGIEKYLNKITAITKPLKFVFRINPKKNWLFLVIFFIFLNLIIMSMGIVRFYKISSNEDFLKEGSLFRKARTIDRGNLSDTILLFETKRENFESLRRNRPRFVDPSL